MSKICPNCLRPVRTGANYCGYCGTSLIPATRENFPIEQSISQNNAGANVRSAPSSRLSPKRGKARRPWVITPIILLFLVIFLALVIRFWPEITAYLGQIVSSIRLL
jgi:hypothetical protein